MLVDRKRVGFAVVMLGLVTAAGCGNEDTAKVHGTVTADGRTVDAGTVIFAPEGEGYPASGALQSDGSYTLSFTQGEGAVVGEYRVRYSPPPPAESAEGGAAQSSQWRNWELPRDFTVAVEPGENDIPLELVRK